MKSKSTRVLSFLLALAIVAMIPLSALATAAPAVTQEAANTDEEPWISVGGDTEVVYKTEYHEGEYPDHEMPSSAVQVGSGDGYTLWQVTDPEQMDELLGLSEDAESTAKYFETEDELVTAMIVVEGSAPLVEDASLNIRLGAQADAAQVQRAQETIFAEQTAVYENICRALAQDVELVGQYSVLTNSFAIEVMASQVADLARVEGVKSCYIAPTFTALPDSAFETAGNLQYDAPGVLAGADAAWERGYTGEGMVIGIVDTGITVGHNAFATIPETQRYTKDTVSDLLSSNFLHAEAQYDGLTVDDVYYSGKIVWKFDYSESDTNVSHGSASSHGTHVAGIAAGNDTTTDEVTALGVKGTAFNAQLAVFKVFSGETASFTNLLAGVEDAVLMGLDAVNLSLGSPAGGTYDEGFTEVFDNALNVGVNVICAAGNDYDASLGNLYGFDMANTKNVDNGVTGIPANYASTLSVASVNSTGYPISNSWTDYGLPQGAFMERLEFEFYDPAPFSKRLNTLLGGKEWETMFVEGYGTAENIAKYDVKGKLVLIYEDRFGESVTTQEVYDNLLAAGAIGIILASEDQEEDDWPSDKTVTRTDIPMAFTMRWCMVDYIRYYEENPEVPQSMAVQPAITPVANSGEISDFSSRGTTVDLTIKPEIAAIGGGVYSSYGSGKTGYAASSGTSMAAPQVAGAAALVRQYLQTEYADYLATLTAKEISELINAILMSTANPIVYQETDLFWTVRSQGAGMLDLAQATVTDAWLTVDGDRPKIELGDDPTRSGEYTLRFEVNNLSDAAKTYTVDTVVQTEGVEVDLINGFDEFGLPEDHGLSKYRYFMSGEPEALDATVGGDATVTVPAGETVTVTVTVRLTEDAKAWLDKYYTKGGYVEGFIFLTETNGDSLSLPFLAFYGDWSEVTIMDNTFYWESPNESSEWLNDAAVWINSALVKDGENYNYLGLRYGSTFGTNASAFGYLTHSEDCNYISPNGDGWRDGLEAVYVGQMRYAEEITYSITNAETGEVYYSKEMYGVPKNIMDVNGDLYPTGADAYSLFEAWYGTDGKGNVLPDGSKVLVNVTFKSTFDGEEKTEAWEFPIYVDSEAPKVEVNMTGSSRYEIELSDNGMLCAYNGVITGKYAYMTLDAAPLPITQEELAENGGTTTWIKGMSSGLKSITLSAWDYAGNSVAYIIVFDSGTVDILEESVDMVVGETYTVTNVGGYDAEGPVVNDPLSWKSAKTSVATVQQNAEDENKAVITAVAVGSTTVTATRKSQTMTDSVAVNVHEGLATITASAGENGSISDAGETVLPKGESKTYTITPDEHYVIQDVLVDGQSVGAVSEYTFTNNENGRTSHTIEAVFAMETFQVRFLDWDDSVLSEQTVAYGAAATAPEAPSREFYTFLCWDTDFSNITADTDVKAVYVENDMTTYYAIAIVSSVGGTVEGPTQVLAGEDATFTITPDENYFLTDVLVDGQSVGAVTTYTFENVDACHYIQAVFHTHEYEAIVTEPTCTEGGYTTYTCACGESYVADHTDALGHEDELVGAKVATCTEDGYTGDTVCAVCGEVLEQGETVPATGHTTELVNVKTATCTEEGYTGDEVCTTCGETVEQGEAIPATGHSFGEWTVTVEPDCFTEGEEVRTCACGETETRVIEASSENCPSKAFTDLDITEWYHEGVDYVLENGLMKGMSDTEFQPKGNLTRAQLVTTLYRMAGEPSVEGMENPFTDVNENDWFAEAVIWAYDAKIVNGTSDTTFAPNVAITREQIAAILYRYSGAEPVEEDYLKDFTDANEVTAYAKDALNWAVAEGLITGMGNGKVAPTGTATRAQIATILMRYCEK